MTPGEPRKLNFKAYLQRNDSKLKAMKRGGRQSPKASKKIKTTTDDGNRVTSDNEVSSGFSSDDDHLGNQLTSKISMDFLNTPLVNKLEKKEVTVTKKPQECPFKIKERTMNDSNIVLIESVPDIPIFKHESPIKKAGLNLDSDESSDDDSGDKDVYSLAQTVKRNRKSIKKLNKRLSFSNSPQSIQKLKTHFTEKYNLPPVISLKDINERSKPFLGIALDILNGDLQSGYYSKAKQISNESTNSILSTTEMRRLDLTFFFAGYYGLMRQYIVGQIIATEYKSNFTRNKSPVLRWWGVEDFCRYVLAPEVLTALCMSEMNIKPKEDEYEEDVKERVFELFQKTKEFGLQVADVELD
ncbi:similar to Saccharomyces cerevisiae YNL254C RTC4 Protein of unknown function [Maudiozyma barnettii]|uniref:Restriction of telomere capping protein 4 n=1 Tax=Maudiozyma barnettii TaxID=61262 RepID=A0A8H2VDZ7_9SACH|nr:Rtc4p [Kazachstania barnettii]CAB4253826.1 similar to Saccharomyces cerevisiae YNL254C RTC4 Protein of unknown function [Kazachstania barnettii]CAD1781575.1 similar to Saccharomyces cerevisiae YNL254C RTC4 Protein of unknown function [Kazachstania barnettii]